MKFWILILGLASIICFVIALCMDIYWEYKDMKSNHKEQ